ncbi:MAG: hypothetical protein PUK40_06325 [Actinomycetaceae bacterium]|nr:hypothetical protein [Arcanobacterium sp.]MDD7505538.1 hypothetical protein [Actinomycetaceae bacterium]
MTAVFLSRLIHDHEAMPAVGTRPPAHRLGFLPFPPGLVPAGGRAKPSPSPSLNRGGTPLAHALDHQQLGLEISAGAV